MKKSQLHKVPRRRKLDRGKIVALIKKRGIAHGLDLSYTDISGAHLGSSMDPMPPLDGAIFGKYGDVRSGVIAENTLFQRTSLREAKFTYANLKGTRFFKSDLTGSDLRFADLTNANLVEACLVGATLFRAQLAGALLMDADLRWADLYQASLSGQSELSKENIGEYLVQEIEKEYISYLQRAVLPTSLQSIEYHLRDRYFKAARIYQDLRIHFQSNGRFADAVWAYRKERRMRKNWNGRQSNDFWQSGQRKKSLQLRLSWLGDWIVEILCDYGESVWRVLGWIFALILIVGPIIIRASGGLMNEMGQATYSYFQYLLYMLDTVTTANFSELKPANDVVRLASGLMAGIGIFLVGLLGFVAGNRIRN